MLNQLKIKIKDITEFLKSSELCHTISVPEQYFMETVKVESVEDCKKLLNIIQHWGAKHIPRQFWDYVIDNTDQQDDIEDLLYSTRFDEGFRNQISHTIELLVGHTGPKRIKVALEQCDKFTIEYLLDHGVYVPINDLLFKCTDKEWIAQLKQRYGSNPVFAPKYHNRYTEINKDVLNKAIKYGDFKTIKMIVNKDSQFEDYQYITFAAYYKNFEIFKYLYENWKHGLSTYNNQHIVGSILQSQSLEMLKYVFEERDYSISSMSPFHIRYIKTIEVFKYLVTKGLKIFSYRNLANTPYDLLDYIFDTYLKENNITIGKKTWDSREVIRDISYTDDYIKRLKYFVSKGFKLYIPITIDDLIPASFGTKTSEEKQSSVDQINKGIKTYPVSDAIMNDKTELIEYLLSQGLEFSEEAMEYATNLKMLKYLNNKKCKWSSKVISKCKYYGYVDCLRYARESGCEEPEEEYTAGTINFFDY